MAKSDFDAMPTTDQCGYGMVEVPQLFHATTLKELAFVNDIGIDGLTSGLQDLAQKSDEEVVQHMKGMLLGQLTILDSLFNTFTKIASQRQPMKGQQIYSELALKSQNQARRTAMSVADLVSPKRTTFIRQQNIANNQQVNNYDSGPAPQQADTDCQIPQNLEKISTIELLDLEVTGGERLDTRTAQKAI